jgi:hypothetical protein
MQVHIESDADGSCVEKLRRFRLGGRSIEVIENIDRWFGPDYCYFKVRGDDGSLYILRLDEARNECELTMFQTAHVHPSPAPAGLTRGFVFFA